MRLENGSRVVVVGGGPAGSCTALHFLRLAQATGLHLHIVLLEARDFNRPGPAGCNKCAGILSSSVIRRLQALDLRLPCDLIQAELDPYILHLGGTALPIYRSDPTRPIYSVYRGSGPRLGNPPYPRSFDSWLLDQARERGADIRRARVLTIRPGEHPVVITAQEQIEADLVVLATGVNSPTPIDSAWHYGPPRTEVMAQDEVQRLGDTTGSVHIYFDHPKGLIFGGLIPKGRYTNISLLGRQLPRNAIDDFLAGPELARSFPDIGERLCGCAPRVAVSAASGYYADRFVAVGDAAITRLYKDGIGAALVTSEAVARTAIERGVSRDAFHAGYRPACQRIVADNQFGQLMFRLWDIPRRVPFLLNTWRRVLLAEAVRPPAQRIHTHVLWGLFTGDESYQAIFMHLLNPMTVLGFMRGML